MRIYGNTFSIHTSCYECKNKVRPKKKRKENINVNPKICPNLIFTLILSPILNPDYIYFFTHLPFNS